MSELPNTIEELLKLRIGVQKALISNVDLNAGKPEMATTEQSLLKDREAIDAKLASLGYVKPNLPKCSCIEEQKACYISADACNYTRIERLSIGCVQEPGINPVGLSSQPQQATQEEEPKKRKRKRRKRESHSRAARAGRAAGVLTQLSEELEGSASTLRNLAQELEQVKEEEEEASPEDAPVDGEGKETDNIKDQIKEEVERIQKVFEDSFSFDDVQNLAEEMRSWSDNVQGTNLENTDKMQTVGTTADTLESAVGDLDGLTFPEMTDEDNISEFADELDQLSQDLSSAASDIENCEFPGMYG